jgi:hypothetical protein
VKGAYWLGRPRFTDGTNAIELRLLPLDPNDHRPGLITASVHLKQATPSHDDHEKALRDILELLALAQRCPILVARFESCDQGRVVRTVVRPNVAAYRTTNPLIPWTPPELKSYFEQTLPRYRQDSGAYDLSRLIAYYSRSFVEETLELKFMMAGVFMEAFKFHWACNVGNLQRTTKANGLIKGFARPTGGAYSFEDLLKLATAHLGYQTTFSFIDDRNAIFHTGAAAARQLGNASVWPALKPELIKLYRQMDDIILRILGYSGPIHPWELADAREDFPSRTPIP